MSDILDKIGKNIHLYRIKKGITQGELARRAKISRGYMNRIENGRINLYLDTLVDIARGLGVRPGDLVK
jgi:transcriptional regulator with XRE-family HTH domain